jgi:hypothetical protein
MRMLHKARRKDKRNVTWGVEKYDGVRGSKRKCHIKMSDKADPEITWTATSPGL